MNVSLLRKYLASPDFERKLNPRLERLQAAESNPVERMQIFMDCRDDIFTFGDLFGVVYEPRLPESPDIPMFFFPHQREMIYRLMEAEDKGEPLFIEKTRDMMATWTVLYYMYWRWRFKDKWYGLIGSRKEEEVDDRTPQSLFGKMRYIHYAQPQWMRPQKFRRSEHDLHMKLVNPDTMSYIDGESANENFARGARAAFIFFDELFFWKNPQKSWRSAQDSAPARIAVSTAVPTTFARRFSESMKEQKRCLTLDWTMHPFKDEEWFKAEEEKRAHDPLAMMGEVGISYRSDPTLAYYPEVDRCPQYDFDYDPNLPLYIGTDFGAKDKTAFIYAQRSVEKVFALDALSQRQKKLSWYYPFLKQGWDFQNQDEYEVVNKFTKEKFILRKTDYSTQELDLIRRFNTWKPPVMVCGEVAHRMTMIKSNTSIAQELAGIGVFLRINDMAVSHSVRRNAVKKLLPRTVFSTRYNASEVFDALAMSQFVEGRNNSTSRDAADKPFHDDEGIADVRSAFENFAVNQSLEGAKVRAVPYRR